MSAAGGGAAAAAAAAIAQAVKASGAIVRIEARDFENLVRRLDEPLVIHSAPGGMFNRKHQYLTSCAGFVFHARTDAPLTLPHKTPTVTAEKIWTPE
jgi:hypothetical protein